MLKKFYLAAAAATMLLAAPAMAADYSVAEPIVGTSWTGFYVGGGAGVAWVDYDAHGNYCDAYGVCVEGNFIDNLVGNLDGDTAFRGIVLAGLDWEIVPGFLIGVQGDYSFGQDLGFDKSNSYVDVYQFYDRASFAIEDMWTLAGRFGWATDQTLFYGLAGWTWANTNLNLKNACFDDCFAEFNNSNSIDGWTLGGGVEFKGWFLENVSTRLEYRYTDFSNASLSGIDDDGFFNKLDTDQSVQAVYLTVNWRFDGL